MPDIQVGDKIRFYYSPNNVNNELIHIRAIVDGDQVVFRRWSREKQRWRYAVESMTYFEVSKEFWAKVK